MAESQRAVMTLATTRVMFLEMAFALARSFVFWNRDAGIDFFIITDLDFEMPHELRDHVQALRVPVGSLGTGYMPKLKLAELAPAPQTIYIDADCLVMGPLAPAFDRFAGRPLAPVGRKVSTGLLWGDVDAILKRINRPALDAFNAGVYYFEPGPAASAVFERAAEIGKHYDEWGLVRLRGVINDEILVSIAMAEANFDALPDDGTVMVPLYLYPVFRELDVFKGRCVVENPPAGHRLHWKTMPAKTVQPVIPHFVDTYTKHWRYVSEAERLRLHMHHGVPQSLARLITFVTLSVPGWIKSNGKDWLRPIYRALFGVRKIKKTDRL